MEQSNQKLSEEEYFKSLKIESEDDLLSDIDGFKFYDYVTQNEINDIKEDTKHLCRVTRFVIEELKWNIRNKRSGNKPYQDIYELFIGHIDLYLEKLKEYHKRVYVSIYKLFDDEILEEYESKLQPLLVEFKNIEIHRSEDRIWNLVDIAFPKLDPSLIIDEEHKKCTDTIADNFYVIFKWYIGIISAKIKEVDFVFSAIYRTRVFRDKAEECIIYNYIKRRFDENFLEAHLALRKREHRQYLEDRRMPISIVFLRGKLDALEQTSCNCTLCRIWRECESSEEETEDLANKLSRVQASPEEFERLFKFQGERKMLKDEIAKLDDMERRGDPLFAPWVDAIRLEEYLKHWIKANITTQQKWYIVWSLMKYTFNMIRDKCGKNEFAERMNLMFPDAEKKCVVSSFRKLPSRMNHDRHFSEWLKDSDHDYPIAEGLYEKLKRKDSYNKD